MVNLLKSPSVISPIPPWGTAKRKTITSHQPHGDENIYHEDRRARHAASHVARDHNSLKSFQHPLYDIFVTDLDTLHPTWTLFPTWTPFDANITTIEDNILSLGVHTDGNKHTEQNQNKYDELKRFDFDVVLLLCRLTQPPEKGCSKREKTNCTERMKKAMAVPIVCALFRQLPLLTPYRHPPKTPSGQNDSDQKEKSIVLQPDAEVAPV